MKAIVIRQPWATLVALGLKQIETRPAPPNGPMRPDGVKGLPGLPLERGERIAIVAGAWNPSESWHLRRFGEWTLLTRHYTDGLPQLRRLGCITPDGKRLVDDAYERGLVVDLPLGSVVCTVRVDDALPIVAEWKAAGTTRFLTAGSTLTLVDANGYGPVAGSYTPQLPLGDFTPGRWGWMLSDPQPCDPIPCKGRQGVFELPAETIDEELAG